MEPSISFPAERRFVPRVARPWLVLVLGVAVVLALAAGLFFLSRSDVFHVRHISVVGNTHLTKREVVQMSGISERSNVLWLSEGAAEQRLEQSSPWVAMARVSVDLPWSVTIDVVERRPVATVTYGASRIAIASDGTPLGPAERGSELPRIVVPPVAAIDGAPPSLAGAARAIGSLPSELVPQIHRVLVGLDGTVQLQVAHGPRILYGRATDLTAKGSTLATVLAWADAEHEQLTEVNLTAPNAPAVELTA